MSFTQKFKQYTSSFYFELFKGPGFIKLKSVLISPIGLLGSFFVVLSLLLPFMGDSTLNLVNLLWYVFYYIIIAQSFNIIGGYGGEIDFGHVVFVGLGVYTVGILYGFHGVNVWLAILLGGFVSAFAALLLGLPILKLRGAYFAVTMLAVANAMSVLFTYFRDFTGGGSGVYVGTLLRDIPDLRLYSYFAVILVAIFSFLVTHYLSYTRLGLALRAIKESPDGAASIGINVHKTKLIAFVISAFLAGLGGGIFMIRILNITPQDAFKTSITEEMIIMTLIGGPGSVFGPIIGAIILVPLRTTLITAFSGLTLTLFGTTLKLEVAYLLIYGLIYIFAILFLPKGIIGFMEDRGFIKRESLIVEEHEEETEEPTNTPDGGTVMSEKVIEVKNVFKIFGGIHALENVNISVNKGEILGLIGPNGAGKTTLFNVISGYYPPTGGTVLLHGQDITDKSILQTIKMGIARTFQLVQIFPELTVLENVMVGALFGRNEVVSYDQAIEDSLEALKVIGMRDYAYKLMKSLVLTERKKIELARVLTTNPEIILLDEIISGLNPSETDEMLVIIDKINKELGITIVFVEHVMKAVMRLSHRIVVLNYGKLIAEGSPKEISQNSDVINAYLGTEVVDKYVEN